MPKYRHRYQWRERIVDGLVILSIANDDEAVRALGALDNDGIPVELWRPERKPRLLATKAADGLVRRVIP